MKRCPECGKPYDDDLTYCPDDGYMLVPETGGEDDPYLGAVFENRYRVVKRVGEGGMGSVYLARNINAEMDVALKVLTAAASKDENVVKRFEAEKRIIAKLRHPNILKLNDSFRAPGGELVIVMEYVNGQPLDDLIRGETLSAARTMYILREVCDALTEAHETGIIHRDLKPSNLMIEHVGDRDIVKILDFGIAKNLEGAEGLTMGHALGTPAYMSPEQVRGSAELDGRSDIYSMGIVAYECLVGKPPFIGSTPYSIIHKHINEIPKPLSDVVPPINCDADAEALIMQLLEKDPDNRPANCREVRDQADWLYHRLKSGGPAGYGSVNFQGGRETVGGSIDMSAETLHGAGVKQSGNRLLVLLSLIAIVALAGAAWVITQDPNSDASTTRSTVAPNDTPQTVKSQTAKKVETAAPAPKQVKPIVQNGNIQPTPQQPPGSTPLEASSKTELTPKADPPSGAAPKPKAPSKNSLATSTATDEPADKEAVQKATAKPASKTKRAKRRQTRPKTKKKRRAKRQKVKANKAKYSDDLFE